MDRKRMADGQGWDREELDRSTRFWLDNGTDQVHGGVYTCLDRQDKVCSTDKSVWMQCHAHISGHSGRVHRMVDQRQAVSLIRNHI